MKIKLRGLWMMLVSAGKTGEITSLANAPYTKTATPRPKSSKTIGGLSATLVAVGSQFPKPFPDCRLEITQDGTIRPEFQATTKDR